MAGGEGEKEKVAEGEERLWGVRESVEGKGGQRIQSERKSENVGEEENKRERGSWM